MRKVYIGLIKKTIRRKRIALLVRSGFKLPVIHVSRLLGRPLCGPLVGFLNVTYRCNLRCKMCEIYNIAEAENSPELDTLAFRGIIDEFVKLGVAAIAFTGGEPLLRPDIYDLISYASQRGMLTHISTNGVLLGSKEAQKLIDTGVESIGISIDGSTVEIHERTRKYPGAFAKATEALGHLVSYREKQKASVRIKILTVVGKNNIDDIHNLIEFARQQRVDGVELMPCQPLSEWVRDEGYSNDGIFLNKVDNLVAELTGNHKYRDLIENSTTHLKLFRNSFEGKCSPLPCLAGNASLVVDCYGKVFPCLPWSSWQQLSGDIKGSGLSSLWKSREYGKIRNLTKNCGRCYLNCHSELSISLGLGRTSVRRRCTTGCY